MLNLIATCALVLIYSPVDYLDNQCFFDIINIQMRRENVKKYWYIILPILIIILGILFRLKGFLVNPSFWHDECGVAWNIKFKSYSELFGVLRFLQVAPPLFLIATKSLTQIFGYSEMVFRFIPLVAGCLSVIAFYFLASKVLNTKSSVFWATFLFAINQELINYSFEFKPYGIDVLFVILLLLFFINLNVEKLDTKKIIVYGLLIAFIPWLSFVSMFVIAGGILNIFFKALKNKDKNALFKIFCFLFPLLISVLFYLKFYLIKNYTGTHMTSDWSPYFVTLNPMHFMYLLSGNIQYLFTPVKYLLFPIILLFWGIFAYAKEKSPFFKIAGLGLMVFLIASFMHIYPFADRVILFLIPIFILFMIKPLDTISFNKKMELSIVLILFFFTAAPQINQVNDFSKSQNINRGEFPREMMQFMTRNLKSTDNIYVSGISNTEFVYYSSFYNIKNNTIQEKFTNTPNKDYIKLLNNLPKGYYWFYLPFDYAKNPINSTIETWANTKKILSEFKNNKSILMYVYVN